ncbi:MAG: hypothetical protein AAB336_03220 [Acidobacteriota bacterium]
MERENLIWITIGILSVIYLLYIAKFSKFTVIPNQPTQERDLLKVLLNLNETSLNQLFKLYKESFGTGAAYYAKRTYQKWKNGKVQPNRQTFERFLMHLPKVMSFDLKCEVLRLFMEELCAKENHSLTVYTDDWEEALTPLVKEIIDKPYRAQLPNEVQKKLTWLSDGEMQTAQEILRKSQIEEGKIAVSMLRQEFENIENLLNETHLKPKVTHQLKFPYGTITLNIKRR